jgi:hypothetical protein
MVDIPYCSPTQQTYGLFSDKKQLVHLLTKEMADPSSCFWHQEKRMAKESFPPTDLIKKKAPKLQ